MTINSHNLLFEKQIEHRLQHNPMVSNPDGAPHRAAFQSQASSRAAFSTGFERHSKCHDLRMIDGRKAKQPPVYLMFLHEHVKEPQKRPQILAKSRGVTVFYPIPCIVNVCPKTMATGHDFCI